MSLVIWILAGALLGVAASAHFGLREWKEYALNAVIGVAGVICSGWVLGLLIGASAFASGDLNFASLLVSLLAASVLLAALRLSRRVVSRKPQTRPDEPSITLELARTKKRDEITARRSKAPDRGDSRLPAGASASR